MKDVKVCVLRIEGTNCEDEAAQAFASVGASPEKVHLKQLLSQCPSDLKRDLGSYDILMLPGGFSAGDYVRAGAIFAARMKSGLKKDIVRFVEDGKPVNRCLQRLPDTGGAGASSGHGRHHVRGA